MCESRKARRNRTSLYQRELAEGLKRATQAARPDKPDARLAKPVPANG